MKGFGGMSSGNGTSNHRADSVDPGRGESGQAKEAREDDVDESRSAFRVRDVIFFKKAEISQYREYDIVIAPAEGEALVERIIMQKGMASRLILERMRLGAKPIGGDGVVAGDCQMFLVDVPNWTPHNLVISPIVPLVLTVRNMIGVGVKIVGQAIIRRRS